MYKGWYNDVVDLNVDIHDGYLHAPQRPGVGTSLKAGIRDRSDARVRVSDTPGTSVIDHYGPYAARTVEAQAAVDEMEIERGPQ